MIRWLVKLIANKKKCIRASYALDQLWIQYDESEKIERIVIMFYEYRGTRWTEYVYTENGLSKEYKVTRPGIDYYWEKFGSLPTGTQWFCDDLKPQKDNVVPLKLVD